MDARCFTRETNLNEFSSAIQFKNMHRDKRHYDSEPEQGTDGPNDVTGNVDPVEPDKHGLETWAV
jgi:hypothetical protein